mgnify:CR=1 FL=1|tara:strand:+ start:5785 stop:6315 length:531 start_codon:yes stop_codon:yes gene_type:complete
MDIELIKSLLTYAITVVFFIMIFNRDYRRVGLVVFLSTLYPILAVDPLVNPTDQEAISRLGVAIKLDGITAFTLVFVFATGDDKQSSLAIKQGALLVFATLLHTVVSLGLLTSADETYIVYMLYAEIIAFICALQLWTARDGIIQSLGSVRRYLHRVLTVRSGFGESNSTQSKVKG